MATKKFESTKGLDEIFTFAYKLRKAGIDYTVVEELSKAILVGASTVSFEVTGDHLTEAQEKLIVLLRENGFEVSQVSSTILVKNIHLDNLKKEIDEYLDKCG